MEHKPQKRENANLKLSVWCANSEVAQWGAVFRWRAVFRIVYFFALVPQFSLGMKIVYKEMIIFFRKSILKKH